MNRIIRPEAPRVESHFVSQIIRLFFFLILAASLDTQEHRMTAWQDAPNLTNLTERVAQRGPCLSLISAAPVISALVLNASEVVQTTCEPDAGATYSTAI